MLVIGHISASNCFGYHKYIIINASQTNLLADVPFFAACTNTDGDFSLSSTETFPMFDVKLSNVCWLNLKVASFADEIKKGPKSLLPDTLFVPNLPVSAEISKFNSTS